MNDENKNELLNKILEVLLSIIDEDDVFYINNAIAKTKECSYEEDYLDIENEANIMYKYLILNNYCTPVDDIQKKLKITDKTKSLINYKEPKRVVEYFGEIEKIAKSTFDFNKLHTIDIGWCLSQTLCDEIKLTPTLLEKVIEYLINEDLVRKGDIDKTKPNEFLLTSKGREVQKIGTYDEYLKSVQKEKDKNKRLLNLNICAKWFAIIGGSLGIFSFAYNLCNEDSVKKDIDSLKTTIDSLNFKTYKLNENQKELDLEYVKHIDSLYFEINKLKKTH